MSFYVDCLALCKPYPYRVLYFTEAALDKLYLCRVTDNLLSANEVEALSKERVSNNAFRAGLDSVSTI